MANAPGSAWQVADTSSAANAPTAEKQELGRFPFIAPDRGGWRERYASITQAAFEARKPCDAHPEQPLRCLLIGHNPSEHAWDSGVGYSNPSNRFWPLLRQSGVLPAGWRDGDEPPARDSEETGAR